jgi:subtilisin family serine protease
VVAVLDTGCGEHDWLPDDIVTREVFLDGVPLGLTDAANPEIYPDLYGPLDGEIDPVAGHGTFIAGLIRQAAPDADLLCIRAADALGVVAESSLLTIIEQLGVLLWRYRNRKKGGRPIDVLNLSLSYYHETPEDGYFSLALFDALKALRLMGCVVVASAGNDAIDRPAFPAALWPWPGSDNGLQPDPGTKPLAVGALNPSLRSTALFSNVGPWVNAYAPGAAVVSTIPAFQGGLQATARDDYDGRRRETIDPDDYRGGFAIWSGTSFAAPLVAGRVAAALTDALTTGSPEPLPGEKAVALADDAIGRALDR